MHLRVTLTGSGQWGHRQEWGQSTSAGMNNHCQHEAFCKQSASTELPILCKQSISNKIVFIFILTWFIARQCISDKSEMWTLNVTKHGCLYKWFIGQ